jgi:hypothetical protein
MDVQLDYRNVGHRWFLARELRLTYGETDRPPLRDIHSRRNSPTR